jgi:uncharacterized protein involved in type VI secretion and phage assembly
MMVGDNRQMGKRLRVITILDQQEKGQDGDPLLMSNLDGHEDISKPFRYELTLYRDPERSYVAPSRLVGTLVHFGVRRSIDDLGDNTAYAYRTGVVEHSECTFLHQDVDKDHARSMDFWVYKLVVVPAFKMLEREVLYRVFEKATVLEVLQYVLKNVPNLEVDFGGIKSESFPVMPYCVQFGESTVNFCSRLMEQFGIWYYFNNGQETSSTDVPVGNGRMKLGRSVAPQDSGSWPLQVDNDAGPDKMSGGTQYCDPPMQWIRVGNFNPLQPIEPFTNATNVVPQFDLLSNAGRSQSPETQSRFRSEIFGADVCSNSEALSRAQFQMTANEAGVFTMSGNSKDPLLVAGHTVDITGSDADGNETRASVLISHLEIKAYEFGYGFNFASNVNDVFANICSPLSGAQGVADFTTNITAQGLNNYLQNQFPYEQQNLWYPSTQKPGNQNQNVPYFVPFVVGGMMASVTALLPAVSGAVGKVAAAESDDYSNSFQAIDWYQSKTRLVPLPQGIKPVARGPHLATVVGQKGVHTAETGGPTVYADTLGRVRIRFPWQRRIEKAGGAPAAGASPDDPWSSDQDTCWVRVTQGWAALDTGWQFIPRIGEEVIVDFIDGDPDQPIVTGRVYHASPSTNLPFPAVGTETTALDMDRLLNASGRDDFRFNGVKTRSTPRPDGKLEGYHLVRFDDTYGDEQLLLRSQGRMDVTAKNSRYETTEGDRHVLVTQAKNQDGGTSGGSSFTTVGGEFDLHVGGNRLEAVDKGYQLTVKGDTQLHLEGNASAIVGSTLSLNAGAVVIEAAEKLTLKVGGSTVVLNPAGVYIDGPMIYKQGGGPADSAAALNMTDVADAARADPGDPANKRASGGSGGGQRQTVLVMPETAFDVVAE